MNSATSRRVRYLAGKRGSLAHGVRKRKDQVKQMLQGLELRNTERAEHRKYIRDRFWQRLRGDQESGL